MCRKETPKEKGKRLLKEGVALIDTSNRTKDIKTKSALALASLKPFYFSVLMLSSDKKKIFHKLSEKQDKGRIPSIVHSVKIYLALKGKIDLFPEIYICADGHNIGFLTHYLKNFLGREYNEKKIKIFPSLKRIFGKKNIADRLAHKVAKKLERPTIKVTEKHFKKLNLL